MSDFRWRAIALGFPAALLSCGTNGPPPAELVPIPSTPATLVVDVGGGVDAFEELADAQEVELVFGSQGGFHIWTSIRVHDERIRAAQVNLLARYEDGTEAGLPSRSVAVFSAADNGTSIASGLRNLVRNAAEARGRRILLRVEVVDAEQRHGAGEKLVLAR